MASQVVIICGPRESYGFCPVPPVTNSAPERNVFRLTEFDYGEELDVHVVSACNRSQLAKIEHKAYLGRYHHLILPQWLLILKYSRLFQNRITQKICRKWCHASDVFTWIYVSLACRRIKGLSPDLILINSLPQYILPIRHRFPQVPLGLFVRGEMGSSRQYLPLTDFIIVNSRGVAQYVEDLLDGTPVPIRVMPNTLELSYCAKEKRRVANKGRKKLVYLGRVDKVKGVFELLRAYQKVQQSFPDTTLLIVGGNYQSGTLTQYEREVFEYATSNQLNVEFIGQVPNNETPEIFLRADIAAFPSIWLESFGMVALEAMRCGLPVIASRRPGFEELVVHDETGILIDDPEDIDSLADAILALLRCPEKAHRMGEAGYIRSLEFTPEKINTHFKQVILDQLSQGVRNGQ